MFYPGDKVNVTVGKYSNHTGIVLGFHPIHNPLLYTLLMENGKEIAVYETEIKPAAKLWRNKLYKKTKKEKR